MDLDVLCMMAHPDDAEILCGGSLIKLKEQGYSVGIVDFSRGEMGTRGDVEQRSREAECAAGIMGIDIRENIEFPDARIENTVENRKQVVRIIRKYRPHIIFTHDANNRNPDHTHTSMLIKESAFTAGLAKYNTGQKPHRPNKILYTMEYFEFEPTIIVDITKQFERKMKAVNCYRSQIHNHECDGLPTYISSDRFTVEIESRMRYFGSRIHADFAEVFRMDTPVEINDIVKEIGLRALIPGQGRKE
ncbi:MAG: bacillithiol biosynthesis deacetylase BshB1 [Candidatus Latescibacteria bacterium]|nr:bacillithiol biosynthesis deacetylase BshB1 [Candidatus Latescibacterota bacterium]